MNNQLKLNFPLPEETFQANFIPCRDRRIIMDLRYNEKRLIETLGEDVLDVFKHMEGKQRGIPEEHIINNLRDNLKNTKSPLNPLSRISYDRAVEIEKIIDNCKNFFEKVKMPKETIIDTIVKGLKAIK